MSATYQSLLHEKIALNKYPSEVTPFYISGLNAVPTSTAETLWGNSNLYTFLTTNMTTPTVSSGSANDTAAGTGARTVYIEGVDSTYTTQSETVTMNGQTGVNLVNSYMTINRIRVLTAGSSDTNAGIIYVGTGVLTSGAPAAGATHGYMAVGVGVAQSFVYAVPSGYTLIINALTCSQSTSATAATNNLWLNTKVNGGPSVVKYAWASVNTGGSTLNLWPSYLVIEEKTQLQGQILSSAVVAVLASATGWLVKNAPTFSQLF